jgi:hypothetical protein
MRLRAERLRHERLVRGLPGQVLFRLVRLQYLPVSVTRRYRDPARGGDVAEAICP